MKNFRIGIVVLVSLMSFNFGLYGKSVEPQKINGLFSPKIANSSSEIYLIWESVEQNDKICDYTVCLNGRLVSETANENSFKSNDFVAEYKKSFYKYFNKKKTGVEMPRTQNCFYKLSELQPETEYKISVAGIDKKKRVIAISDEITVKTAGAKKTVLNVADFGAVQSDKIFLSDVEKKDFISANTAAIQKAIDSCPEKGEVLIPEGLFVSGALHLKSNITFRVEGELFSSPFSEHYDFGFLMYEYYTDERFYGILNANQAENIRIVGKGVINGNGWKVSKDGQEMFYKEPGDPDDEKYRLPLYPKGSFKKVAQSGELAADCANAYLNSDLNQDESEKYSDATLRNAYATRSTLVILENVKNLFIGELTFKNPANHTINIINSDTVYITGIKEFTFDCNNGDGIGFICSQNGVFWNNFIDTGDDSIVFGAGVGKSAFLTNQKGVDNVKIFGNFIHHGHGGVAFGSHTALGIKNVYVTDNIFNCTDSPFRIKSAPANGGEVCDIVFKNNDIAQTSLPFTLSTEYSDAGTVTKYGAAEKVAVFHNLKISDCTLYGVKEYMISINGRAQNPHHDIEIKNILLSQLGMSEIKYLNSGRCALMNIADSHFSGVKIILYNGKMLSGNDSEIWKIKQNVDNVSFE